ncbi:MAG: alpha-hydroxy acid oxidase [Actinobacteria bacterium]|nr:alpha-hydroxy acid oxidase [Actinomycetota bacterium]
MSTPPSTASAGWLAALQNQVRELLDPAVFDWLVGGSGLEESLTATESAWSELALRPDAGIDVSAVDLTTDLLGSRVSAPIGVAPTGFHVLVHPDGEAATSTATSAIGLLFTLSSRASQRYDAIVQPQQVWWFQPYVMRDRGLTREQIQQATALGARAMVLTADAPVLPARRQSRNGRLVTPEIMTMNAPNTTDLTTLEQSPTTTVADVEWIREASGLPVVVKGVVRDDTAARFVNAGAEAIWVSNHGGRQLDGAVAPVRALPRIVDEVGDRAQVYIDGGVRSGVDVLRALALGASAVFLGRAPLYGLAIDGEQGVTDVLQRMINELRVSMQLSGRTSIDQLGRDLIWS